MLALLRDASMAHPAGSQAPCWIASTLLDRKLGHFRKTFICNAVQHDEGQKVNGVACHPGCVSDASAMHR